MYRQSLLLFVAVFGTSQAVQWENGTCPNFESLPRFLPTQDLMSRFFYERKSLNNFIFNDEGKCTSVYNVFSHGVLSSTYEQINNNNETDMAYGVASVVDDPNFMEKKVFHFRFFGEHLQPLEIPAVIIATDMENYSVTYSCKQITDAETEESKKLETAWIYTGKRGDASYDRKIQKDLEALGLDYNSFKVTDQSDCPEQ